jgi:cell division protein FtsQ
MARNQGPTSDDPTYLRGQASRGSYADDSLPLDAGLTEEDGEDDQPQFRRAKRVPVRRGALPRKTASRVRNLVVFFIVLAALGAAAYETYSFGVHSWRFRVRRDSIELAGEAPNSRALVLQKMYEVVDKNIFQISLAQEKRELEKIPWVETASVIRLWPNHLRVMVKERTPVAFIALGDHVDLIDAEGSLMDIPQGVQTDYSFPVIQGMNENEPLSTRAPRMKTYMRLVRELDGGDGSTQDKVQYSRNLDEVDLSDPDDVKVVARGGSAPILLHLGNEDFLQRFMVFLSNVQKLEQDQGKLESVDLRYGRKVFVNKDLHVAPPPTPPQVAKAEPPPPHAASQHAAQAKKSSSVHRPQKKRK